MHHAVPISKNVVHTRQLYYFIMRELEKEEKIENLLHLYGRNSRPFKIIDWVRQATLREPPKEY